MIEYEVFDEERPSYLPSYFMSGFLLLGVASLAYYRLPFWPLSFAHVFLAVWFGVLFRCVLQYSRQAKSFSSNRLCVTNDTYAHTFRYAVKEATHVEMLIAEIREIKISNTDPRYIAVAGKSNWDMYFLPPSADTARLVAALTAANPAIRVTT
jgi:hypothetical protein